MVHEARERCAEDDFCAEALVTLFNGGRAPTAAEARDRLRHAPAAVKFFDPAADWAPLTDFEYCTEVDRLDFVLRLCTGADGWRELERIDVPAATA